MRRRTFDFTTSALMLSYAWNLCTPFCCAESLRFVAWIPSSTDVVPLAGHHSWGQRRTGFLFGKC